MATYVLSFKTFKRYCKLRQEIGPPHIPGKKVKINMCEKLMDRYYEGRKTTSLCRCTESNCPVTDRLSSCYTINLDPED